MTNDEVKDKQEETLNNLKKYNEVRKTEIVDDKPETKEQRRDRISLTRREESFTEEDPSEYTKIKVVPYLGDDPVLPEVEFEPVGPDVDDELETITEIVEKSIIEAAEAEGAPDVPQAYQFTPPSLDFGLPLLCQYCGNVAYQGQIHGLGYCREKIQYES